MYAIYSGQAGVMVFVRGAEANVFRSKESTSTTIARESVGYLFQGCNDVTIAPEISEQQARTNFQVAWEQDRTLRLLLIALDVEEEPDLRSDAAECVEEALQSGAAREFVENQLYSRGLPEEADPQFLATDSRWPRTSELIRHIVQQQPSIVLHRNAWDALSNDLFEQGKTEFEELAIAKGAFRILASIDPATKDPNLAILACHAAVRSLPNAREIVSTWTKNFKRQGFKPIIVPDEVDGDSVHAATASASPYEEYQSVLQQQQAIVAKMRVGSVRLARRYTDELIESQLKGGDAQFAAMSLCSLAQRAKEFGLSSLQLEWAERAVRIAPDDSWAHGQAADALMQFSRLDEALIELAQSEAYGDVRFAATGRARILRQQGRLDEALSAFRDVQKRFPDEPFAWAGSAETLRDMWRMEEALAEYQSAIKKFPGELAFQCGRAAVLSDLGRLDEALTAYNSPELRDDVVAINGRAGVLKVMGRLKEALREINYAIELFPTDPSARCSRADIYRVEGELDTALELYANVKKTSPTVSVAYSGYAEVLRDMRRYPEAIAAYEEAKTLFPFDLYLANGYANIRKVNDELDEALRLHEGNVRRFPYSLIAKLGRADLLKRLGKYQDALGAYDDIMSVAPTFAAAKNGKAAILIVLGDYNQARALLPEKAPETRDDWIAWHIRGLAFLRSGETDQAIRHFEAGRAKAPFARERRYFERALSIARMRKGEFSDAISILQGVGGQGLSNILRMHAHAGKGELSEAEVAYRQLSERCPAQLIDLKEAIAARYGLIAEAKPHANDNWIFGREAEALLQAA